MVSKHKQYYISNKVSGQKKLLYINKKTFDSHYNTITEGLIPKADTF